MLQASLSLGQGCLLHGKLLPWWAARGWTFRDLPRKAEKFRPLPHPRCCLPGQRLRWWRVLSCPAQRSCGTPSQDSIQGQQRRPRRGHKLHYSQAAIRQRCRAQAQQLRTWHLSGPWPEPQAQGASAKRDSGKGESLRGWTHGPTFLDVEEEPVGALPGFSAPRVNICPLDSGPVK